jgi:hypothetical protein
LNGLDVFAIGYVGQISEFGESSLFTNVASGAFDICSQKLSNSRWEADLELFGFDKVIVVSESNTKRNLKVCRDGQY